MNLSGEVDKTESELATRARRGDAAAWEALVELHQTAAFRLAYLLVGDPDEAEDVAQEAFIRAYGALHRFDTSRPFRPWLLSITANLARNQRRAMGRYMAALFRLGQATDEPGVDSDVEVHGHWEARTLWQAVRKLKPASQEIIYLRYFLSLSEAESAETLGVAPGTVKSRLSRALAELQRVAERDFPQLREGRGG